MVFKRWMKVAISYGKLTLKTYLSVTSRQTTRTFPFHKEEPSTFLSLKERKGTLSLCSANIYSVGHVEIKTGFLEGAPSLARRNRRQLLFTFLWSTWYQGGKYQHQHTASPSRSQAQVPDTVCSSFQSLKQALSFFLVGTRVYGTQKSVFQTKRLFFILITSADNLSLP